MILEFNTIYGQVPESVINSARRQIMSILHSCKNFRKAEITLKEDKYITGAENKICLIKLQVNGDWRVIHSRTIRFDASITKAAAELKKFVILHGKKRKQRELAA